MTLDTRIYITDKIDHRAVFDRVNDLLKIPATRIEIEGPTQHGDFDYQISNRLGQGFAAWVMSWSRQDGTPTFPKHDEDDIEDAEEEGYDLPDLPPPHFIQVSMDTGYTYSGGAGESCTVLHAKVIVDLYNWLQERGMGLSWKNEYTGSIHEGLDGLGEFLGSGDKAREWFEQIVVPSIPGMTQEG